MPTIFELGEKESLKRALAPLKATAFAIIGSGDDAALLKAPDGNYLVSTDTMIENHDFRLDFSSAFDLGGKAIATNYSDIAAMGGMPTAAVVAISVRAETDIDWLTEFVRGLQQASETLAPGSGIVGGDLATSEQGFISVTAFGDLDGLKPLVRSNAQPGDGLFFHGNLLHRSDRNTSDDPRWSLICCYNTKMNNPYKESRHPSYTPLVPLPNAEFVLEARRLLDGLRSLEEGL